MIHPTPALSSLQQLSRTHSHQCTINYAHQNNVNHSLADPMQEYAAPITAGEATFQRKECNEEEGISEAIIGSRFRNYDILEGYGNMCVGEFAFDDVVDKDGIGGGDAGCDGQRKDLRVGFVSLLLSTSILLPHLPSTLYFRNHGQDERKDSQYLHLATPPISSPQSPATLRSLLVPAACSSSSSSFPDTFLAAVHQPTLVVRPTQAGKRRASPHLGGPGSH